MVFCLKTPSDQTEYLKIYRFVDGDTKYKIAVTKRRAKCGTKIMCHENFVKLRHRIPGKPAQIIEQMLTNTTTFFEADTVHIIVIKGKPSEIGGLDDGVFSSALKFQKRCDKLFVMSEKAFRKILKQHLLS